MTYGELSKLKTQGWETNHVIDDLVGNQRWGGKGWEKIEISAHDLEMIFRSAQKDGVTLPRPLSLAIMPSVRPL